METSKRKKLSMRHRHLLRKAVDHKRRGWPLARRQLQGELARKMWDVEHRQRFAEKIRDLHRDGRYIGEGNPNAVVSWAIVHQMREDYKDEALMFTFITLAEKYDVSITLVSKIIRNLEWVDTNYTPPSRNDVKRRGIEFRRNRVDDRPGFG